MEPEINFNSQTQTEGNGGQIAAVLLAVIICGLIAYFSGFTKNVKLTATQKGLTTVTAPTVETKINPYNTISLEAKSAYVWDIKGNKVLFEKKSDDILPLASIAKVMTATVASEILTPTTTIIISKNDLMQDGDNGLLLNERWSFKKLLDFTMLVSSNDGASAIANTVGENFVEKMNQKAKSLNLTTMRFYNATGLDQSTSTSGAYSSASDLAKLISYSLTNSPEIFTATRYAKYTTASKDQVHIATNTDEEVNNIPGIIGSKTGFTDLAGGNLVVVYDAGVNYPIVVVVLGSSYKGRFEDVKNLVRATNQVLSYNMN